MEDKMNLLTIIGPTASGKTQLAVAVALRTNAEILSGDSRQVYRRMDIGTGKDLEDYRVGNVAVPYHLIDIVEPGTKYNVFEFQRDFLNAYQEIVAANHLPLLCGGTGMYVESVLRGYRLLPVPENPTLRAELEQKSMDELVALLSTYKQLHNTTDVDNKKRAIRAIEIEEYYLHTPLTEREFPKIKSCVVGVSVDRDTRRERITRRLKERLEHGMVDEVAGLLKEGIPAENLIYYGLEYKYVTQYVLGEITYDEMFHGLETAIHQFAKRQMTWFRGMERRGITIHWVDGSLPMEQKVNEVLHLMEANLK